MPLSPRQVFLRLSTTRSSQAGAAPRNRTGSIGTILALGIFSISQAAGPKIVRIALSEDYAPWSSGSGAQVHGLSRDLLEAILVKRMGYQVEFRGYPWARAQEQAFTNRADAICTAISSERSKSLLPSAQPVFVHAIHIFAANRPMVLDKLEGVRDLATLNAAPVRFLTYTGSGWLRDHLDPAKTDVSGSLEQVMEKLAKGRGDVVVENNLVVRPMLKKLGIQNQIVELSPTVDSLAFHLLINKHSDWIPHLKEFDEALRKFMKSPEHTEILRRYGL